MSRYEPVEHIDDPDNPELTDADVARMRPAREVMSPERLKALVEEREVFLKLKPETIAAFAVEGDDWRERMAEALEKIARDKRAA
ncbi:BrnA antitoxin family protein [Brevundimonas balnearis]|uniref:BrnA antitoxin family protein n=1 Tax=Brevundimonas balnearis TaxID=1572858 RepID=A0ABV6R359_9CAUL